MPFAFLAPLFLAGALAIAIPIIVHLTHKEKKDIQRFPSLMFVRKIPYKSTRKQTIRHWFLLLMRVTALLLIASAFARPFMDKEMPPVPAGVGARELVVLLDRSASMGYQGRWEAARRAATEAISGIKEDERATLVLFDERAEAVRAQDSDVSPLRSALQKAMPSALGTRYAPPLRMAQSILQGTTRPRREVVMITDLQRTGWNTRETIELPTGTEFRVVDVGRDSVANVAVAGVNFARARFAVRERVTPTARVLNRSNAPVTLPIVLELDGREAQRRNVTIQPQQAATVQFEEFTLSTNTRGAIVAGNDAYAADNRFYFVLVPGQAAAVSVTRALGNTADEALYLERALGAGGDPVFEVNVSQQTAPDGALRAGAVAALLDVVPSASDARRLHRFVEAGGGLLVVLGGRSGGWRGDAAELLPGTVGGTVEREIAEPGRIATIQYGHRIFENFRAPRAGDFTSARMYRYRELDVPDASAVLARFDDGRVAIAEKRIGAGRILVLSSPLDNLWSDLPVQPVFAPFVREVTAYLAGSRAVNTWRTAGEVVDAAILLEGAPVAAKGEVVVLSPSGERSAIPAAAGGLLALNEQGFYQVRAPGQSASRPVAVNVNPSESDPARLPESELRSAILTTGTTRTAQAVDSTTPLENERRQSLWWYLLIGSVILLVAESFISNRLSRVARA